jgi:glycosyltransferase involved in cell wall biosynthesis
MSAPGPLISVIIPSCGRIESLKKCAAGLAGQTFDRSQFEVIIVNDGSSANFSPVVDAATKIDLKIITQNQAGPASARNRGAAEARGQLLAFTDDDCVPDANWLSAIAARAVGRPGCLIGGQTFNALPNDPYSSASHALIEYFYAYLNQDPNNAVSFPSNNIAMPAENFRAMGGFDTTYPFAAAEDRDFCQRWLDHKFTMIFAPEMHIHQIPRETKTNSQRLRARQLLSRSAAFPLESGKWLPRNADDNPARDIANCQHVRLFHRSRRRPFRPREKVINARRHSGIRINAPALRHAAPAGCVWSSRPAARR